MTRYHITRPQETTVEAVETLEQAYARALACAHELPYVRIWDQVALAYVSGRITRDSGITEAE